MRKRPVARRGRMTVWNESVNAARMHASPAHNQKICKSIPPNTHSKKKRPTGVNTHCITACNSHVDWKMVDALSKSSGAAGQLGFTFEEPARPQRRIWKVSELAGELRAEVEHIFSDLWIEGEISDLRPAASGHIYFTLKDESAQFSVVLFRRQATLLRFRPEDGLHILLRGKLSLYEQRGQMQIIAEHLEPMGAGSLQLAFEQVKRQLQREGLFDSERKKPLPAFPRCAGIVTSPTGAVIRDFVNVAGRRHSALQVLLYPALVQGDSAAADVASGIAYFNRSQEVDVIVIARGGGSLEDLAPFN